MIFDVSLGNSGPHATPQLLADTARAADELGYRAIWTSDHLLAPSTLPQFSRIFEPLTVLSYLAAITERVLLGTSVIVLPMRSPFVVAKQAATLDLLSHGRAVLGIGVGSFAEEYVNVHAEFGNRGARMDEMIALFRHLWSGNRGPFAGRFYGFADGVFEPLPPQRGDLRLLVGGRSDAALRRAGRHAAFWQTTTATPELFPSLVEKIRAEPRGHDVEVGTVCAFNDSLESVTETVRNWEKAGAQHLSVSFGPADGRLERMQAFATAFGINHA
ncbi:MAG: TIGR03619 family F420-dependent LLM class oxidoreductase [Chloroflexi bacterium]|nr:TIGR03619 family F420-dependent LLM class oxidoreductase [Chloroflexota bacterium]